MKKKFKNGSHIAFIFYLYVIIRYDYKHIIIYFNIANAQTYIE